MGVNEFDGLRAVVTGGGSGIGAATARMLADQGAVVAVLDRDPGEAHLPVIADVSGPLESAMDSAAQGLGGLDILVNCAGVSAVGTVADNDDAEWHRVLDINVVGTARACRAALPWLRQSRVPVIVNISSIAATAGLVNRVLYSATKGAVQAMTLAMAADLVRDGIRVCAVAPGTVDTPWVARLLSASADPEGDRVRLAARQPTGRLVTAEEVAAAVLYLASPRNGSTTGVCLPVDGGMSGLRLINS